MAALLNLYGVTSTDEKHVHYRMIELAEAGLRDLKSKAESGFDLLDLITS
jgi:hypothetical protein